MRLALGDSAREGQRRKADTANVRTGGNMRKHRKPSPAYGIMFGLALGALMWAGIFAAMWAVDNHPSLTLAFALAALVCVVLVKSFRRSES